MSTRFAAFLGAIGFAAFAGAAFLAPTLSGQTAADPCVGRAISA